MESGAVDDTSAARSPTPAPIRILPGRDADCHSALPCGCVDGVRGECRGGRPVRFAGDETQRGHSRLRGSRRLLDSHVLCVFGTRRSSAVPFYLNDSGLSSHASS